MVNLPFVGQPEWGEQLNHAIEELDSTVNEGRLSPASLSTTIGTEAVAPARQAAMEYLADEPAVTDAAALRAGSVATDPLVAGAIDTPGSATSKRVSDAVNVRGYTIPGGTTDQRTALLAAINAAANAAAPATSPGGTWPVTPTGANYLNIPDGATLHWDATAGTTLKIPDGAVTANNQRLLHLRSPQTQGEAARITGLTIDGNRRGNLPPGEYTWEHNALLTLANIKHVTLRDLTFHDPIADCVWINSYSGHTVVIDGMNVTSRAGSRSDISFSGMPRHARVTNFIGQRIEAELVTLPAGTEERTAIVQMENVTCAHSFDWAVGLTGMAVTLQVTNSHLADPTIIGGHTKITNTVLRYGPNSFNDRRLRWPEDLTFDNCDIYLTSDAAGVIMPIRIESAAGRNTRVRYTNCRVHLVPHPDYTGTTFTGPAIFLAPVNATAGTNYEIRNTWFDPRFEMSVQHDRAGNLTLKDNTYAGRGSKAINLSNTIANENRIVIDGGDWSAVQGAPVWLSAGSTAVGSLTVRNVTGIGGLHGSGESNIALATGFTFSSSRVALVDAAPGTTGGAIAGDRARLRVPVPGQPVEWVATRTTYGNPTWKVSQTAAA